MAKRKNKKSNIKLILTLIALLFGLVAIASLFLPLVTITDTEIAYTGLEVAFGKSENALGGIISTKVLSTSILSVVNYALVLVGLLFLIVGSVGKGKKIAILISALAFIASAVMFFLHVNFVMPSIPSGVEGEALQQALNAYRNALSIGIGAIVATISSAISAVCCGIKLVIK